MKNYTPQPGFKQQIITQQFKSQKEFNEKIEKKKQMKLSEKIIRLAKYKPIISKWSEAAY